MGDVRWPLRLGQYCDVIQHAAVRVCELRPALERRTLVAGGWRLTPDELVAGVVDDLRTAVGAHDGPREVDVSARADLVVSAAEDLVTALRAPGPVRPGQRTLQRSERVPLARRLAHRLTIAAVDLGEAAGQNAFDDLDDELALDGIDELVLQLVPGQHPMTLLADDVGQADPRLLVLGVHAIGTDAEWTIRVDEAGIVAHCGADRVDVEIAGTAIELYLALRHRRPVAEVSDSDLVAERWARVRPAQGALAQERPANLDLALARAFHLYFAVLRASGSGSVGPETEVYAWASDVVRDRVERRDRAVEMLDAMVAQGADDPRFLAFVAAGPLEDLLRPLDGEVDAASAQAIEGRARRDPLWREALRGVWMDPRSHRQLPAALQELVIELS